MEFITTHWLSILLIWLGATFYSFFQLAQSRLIQRKHAWQTVVIDFCSAFFTGVLCGLGAAGLSHEAGVSLALHGGGALLGPKGFDKILLSVTKR